MCKVFTSHNKFPWITLFILIIVSQSQAFNDDSKDDTRSSRFNSICENYQVLNDTPTLKFSCLGDVVHLENRNSTLIKNGITIARLPILDFKVSRNGKVYYRSQNGPFLLNESGQLNSLAGAVRIYLVSTDGNIVYINDQGIVFKNGEPLNNKHGRVSLQIKEESGGNSFTSPNLAVSRNGQAIFVNAMGQLYVNKIKMSPRTTKVKLFKVDKDANVYFLDDLGRLYRNQNVISQKPAKVKEFKLNAQGQIAYLTDGNSKNLFFENLNLTAGSHRITGFSFTGTGEVIYRDDKGRFWKMGKLILD